MNDVAKAEGHGALLDAVVEHYASCLEGSTTAMAFLDRLGVDEGLRLRYRLGVCDRTLGKALPNKKLARGRAVREALCQVGVLRSTGHEHFRGMLFVPVLDGDGQVLQAFGYRLKRVRSGKPEMVSLRRAPAVWTADAAASGERVVLATHPLVGLALVGAGVAGVRAFVGGDCELPGHVRRVVVVGLEEEAGEVRRLQSMFAGSSADVETCSIPGGLGDVRGRHLAQLVDEVLMGDAQTRSSLPPAPAPDTDTEGDDPTSARVDELTFAFGDRAWRVRGLQTNRARGTLRLNVMVRRVDGCFHLDALDLCIARQRHAFVRAATGEVDVPEPVLKRDLGKVLLELEEKQDLMLARLEQPEPDTPTMTEARRKAATDLLESPDLLDRMLADLEVLGVVGERDNLLILLLTVVSRVLRHPLAVVVQSTPAAGKSNLVQTVLSLVPEERRHVYTAITGQSLYYMGSTDLRHGVLSLAEEAGVGKAAYALKLLQSDGHLTIATTAKDPDTGRMRAQRYQVEGPVALVMTTTAFDIDPELVSRALVLTVDESTTQTAQIHARQRRAHTLEGLRDAGRRDALVELHQDAQRLLEPLRVVCPTDLLTGYGDLRVRARRDHRKLLSLVESVVLLHQFQRERHAIDVDGTRVDYVTATTDDIDLARRLLRLVTPGIDELPRHTARVYQRVVQFVRSRAEQLELRPMEVRFRRRELAADLPLSPTQLKLHLGRLVDAELLLRHATGDGGAAYSVRVFQYDAGEPEGGWRGARPGKTLDSRATSSSCSEGGRSTRDARAPGSAGARIRTGTGPDDDKGQSS